MSERAPTLYHALHAAMQAGLVRACHDLSEGGLAVALAEMCIAGRLGAAVTLNTAYPAIMLFSESNGRLLVEIRPADCAKFEAHFANLSLQRLGLVTNGPRLSVTTRTEKLLEVLVADLVKAWNGETVTSEQ